MAKSPPARAGDVGQIPGWAGSPEGGNGSPLQHSCLETSLDRGVQQAAARGVAEGRTGSSGLQPVGLRRAGQELVAESQREHQPPQAASCAPLAPGPSPCCWPASCTPRLVVGPEGLAGACCAHLVVLRAGVCGAGRASAPGPSEGSWAGLCVLAAALCPSAAQPSGACVASVCLLFQAAFVPGPMLPHSRPFCLRCFARSGMSRGTRGGCLWFLGTAVGLVPSVCCRVAPCARACLRGCLPCVDVCSSPVPSREYGRCVRSHSRDCSDSSASV